MADSELMRFNDNKAFTLVELMVVVGLTSVVALGIASMMRNQALSGKQISNTADVNQLRDQVITDLNNSVYCTAQLAGYPLPAGPPYSPFIATRTDAKTFGGNDIQAFKTDTAVKENSIYGGVTINKIRITNTGSTGVKNGYTAQLDVFYTPNKAAGQIPGGASAISSFEVPVTMTVGVDNANNITDCSAKNDICDPANGAICQAPYIPMFTGGGGLEDSVIYENKKNSYIGIGTIAPTNTLHVYEKTDLNDNNYSVAQFETKDTWRTGIDIVNDTLTGTDGNPIAWRMSTMGAGMTYPGAPGDFGVALTSSPAKCGSNGGFGGAMFPSFAINGTNGYVGVGTPTAYRALDVEEPQCDNQIPVSRFASYNAGGTSVRIHNLCTNDRWELIQNSGAGNATGGAACTFGGPEFNPAQAYANDPFGTALQLNKNANGSPQSIVWFDYPTGANHPYVAINATAPPGPPNQSAKDVLWVNGLAETLNLIVDNNFTAGGCTLGGNPPGNLSCTSDIRLKKDITPIEDSLDKILQINGVTFNWKDPKKNGDRKHMGVIAQEVEKVFPEVVVDNPDTGYKMVAYDLLVAPLIQAVKELYAKLEHLIDSVDSRFAKIEQENQKLRSENAAIKAYLCSKDPASAFCR